MNQNKPDLVFVGPTIPHDEVQRVADVICLPPAVQGSIIDAVRHFDPAAILIIDGVFQSEPAVRHKEILWAIHKGIPVIGAASMGALRAAELHPHMHGVGLIYRWYRRYAFAPDDAVAVLHGPEQVRFAPLTHALVDLRRTLRNAVRQQVVSLQQARAFEDAAFNLNFRDRTLGRMILDALTASQLVEVQRIEGALHSAFIQQKKQDALLALKLLRQKDLFPAPTFDFKLTIAFMQDLDDAGLEI